MGCNLTMVQYLDCAFLGAAISKGKKPPPQSNKPKKLKLAGHNVHSGNRGVFYAMASFALQIGRESYPKLSRGFWIMLLPKHLKKYADSDFLGNVPLFLP